MLRAAIQSILDLCVSSRPLPATNDIEMQALLLVDNPQTDDLINEGIAEKLSGWFIAHRLAMLALSNGNAPRITLTASLVLVQAGLNFLTPYLLGETINSISNSLSNKNTNTKLLGLSLNTWNMLLFVGSYIAAGALSNVRQQLMIPVTQNTIKQILQESTEHMLKKSLDYHIKTPRDDKIYLIQKSYSIGRLGTSVVAEILPVVIETAIACAILSSRYGSGMGLGVLALLACSTLYSRSTIQPIIDAGDKSLEAGTKAWKMFQNAIERYKTMRDCGQLERTITELEASLTQSTETDIHADALRLKIGLGLQGISYLSMLMAVLYVGMHVESGEFSLQDFVLIVGYSQQLAASLPAFVQASNTLIASYPDLNFVFSELNKPDEVVDAYPDTRLAITPNVAPSIEFRDVTFFYPGKQEAAFKHLSFKINEGENVAFVSQSGVGKTTIFNLLFRYYQPTSGEIFINGQDISTVSIYDLQNKINLFGQDPNLFSGTIRENILYCSEHPDTTTDEDIDTIAKNVQLFDFLHGFEKGLDTSVGDDGKALSGGQKQKVAILRGLLKNSPIRLLDEVTAPFDAKSAASILPALRNQEGVTTLMITHKLPEVRAVNRIFVIDQNGLVDQGTNTELLSRCTLYQELWKNYNAEEKSLAKKQNEPAVTDETLSDTHGQLTGRDVVHHYKEKLTEVNPDKRDYGSISGLEK